ncbi:NAD-dependent glutamate dehydrogenase, partial [Entophlyctis sp. JEL0112]
MAPPLRAALITHCARVQASLSAGSPSFRSQSSRLPAAHTALRLLPLLPHWSAIRFYSSTIDKAAQMKKVSEILNQGGFIPSSLLDQEVSFFYEKLGISDLYFKVEPAETVAEHILSLYSAKISGFIKHENVLDINLDKQTETSAVFVHTNIPGVGSVNGKNYEKYIDEKYLDIPAPFRLESYRSESVQLPTFSTHLRSYFLNKCAFPPPPPASAPFDIRAISDASFSEAMTDVTERIYSRVVQEVLNQTGPVIEIHDVQNSHEKRLVVGYKTGHSKFLLSALSDLYKHYGLRCSRKFVEPFSNGVTVMSVYLGPSLKPNPRPFEYCISQVAKETSLLLCIPQTPFQELFKAGKLCVQESTYAYTNWIFAQHFLNRLGREYSMLEKILDGKNNSNHIEVLSNIRKRLRSDTFTRAHILDIIKMYPELIKFCYAAFAAEHQIGRSDELSITKALSEKELLEKIQKTVANAQEALIFESFLTFNKHVLKTNFYQSTKVALSFRMDPSFLPATEYPQPLFGMFLIIGAEFRGFHLRFQDIARGGIRIVRSRNAEAYSINLRSLFDENYGLANTQERKNKDIPEGGSKGTILLDAGSGDAQRAFEKYVDAVLELVVAPEGDAIEYKYGKPEILFFGPDEGTAEFMDWASHHAKRRGASFWKAFTTGKSQSMGGIPHDLYGMTTRSVHQYVVGIFGKLGIDESSVTKMQMGGPDGDLGSNEILISKDITIGIVDGSGVVYDPSGLDRAELTRLARERKMINNFSLKRLSDKGFRVLLDETNVTLPDGTVVDNGVKFRNEFHLTPLSSADLFVPCGGRPEAVDIQNVHRLFNPDGTPRFKYIVEGANLFITQDARLKLEKGGVILFKDASANKGGVTSSSLEVLAALSFSDADFTSQMTSTAAMEFECLWNEAERTKLPKSVLSDKLSLGIVKLNGELQNTTLWENVALRRAILAEAFPKLLVDEIGLDTLMARVPESYVRAIFGSYLASRFVYKY